MSADERRDGAAPFALGFEEVVAGAALILVVASVCWGVVTRYVTQTPAVWTGDTAVLGFAWLIFVGSASAFKYGMHMSVDLLVNLFPEPLRRAAAVAADVLVLAFLAVFVVLALQFCVRSWDDPMPILRWPRSAIYASEVVGGLCMAWRYAALAWQRWRGLTPRLPELPQPDEVGLDAGAGPGAAARA